MRYIYIFYFEIGCLSFIEYIFKHCVFSSEYVISYCILYYYVYCTSLRLAIAVVYNFLVCILW